MAGAKLASGIKTKLFAKKGYDLSGTVNYASITHATTGLTLDANLVKNVSEIGDITKSANTISANFYGEDAQVNIAGFSTLEEWSITISLDESNSIHQGMVDDAVGTGYVFAVRTETSSSNISVTVMDCEIGGSAIQNTADGFRSLNLTLTVKSAPKTYRQG